MKGDLHTLKRVCEYASKTMVLGEIVILVVCAAVLILGLLAPSSDSAAGILKSVAGLSIPSDTASYADLVRVIFILVLGWYTVHVIRVLMQSIEREHSPFTDGNVHPVVSASKIYIIAAVVLGALTAVSSGNVGETAFVFFGCIMIGVVLYCLGLIIRYGAVLQDESDHTL